MLVSVPFGVTCSCLQSQTTQQKHDHSSQTQLFVLQVRELQERIQKAAACTCLLPLGRDRLYRRYWILPSASALFVEDDCFGLTEDMLQPNPKPEQEATVNKMEAEEVTKEEPAEGRWVTVLFGLICEMSYEVQRAFEP